MYSRLISAPENKSFFLFGPRGTGKTTWVKKTFSKGVYLDLLDASVLNDLLAQPQRLSDFIPKGSERWVVIDEVQRVPQLLSEVHRLIETRRVRFVLTGSSARTLRKKGVNLLAGRALTLHMHPLVTQELGKDFDLSFSLRYGGLPSIYQEKDPEKYLESYVQTYLREEVQQEGLTRNLGAFSRFLEAASFSQGSTLNIAAVARECGIERKVVENYFSILEDLLIATRIPVFTKKAKRRMIDHSKFYFFDTGVFRTVRPKGPLDLPEQIEGQSLETLVFQELRSMNDYLNLGHTLYYWRTAAGAEVDFVLYGPQGLLAFEIKRRAKVADSDLQSLSLFLSDYPIAKAYLIYGGTKREYRKGITLLPFEDFFRSLPKILKNKK